jgi:hypothetical protein
MKNIRNKNMKWWVGIISCFSLFLIIGIFSYGKMIFVFKSIQIEATISQKTDSSLIDIKGFAPKAVNLSLNGREIFINKEGQFSESMAILPGFSIITIKAVDKFGKVSEKKFQIVKEIEMPTIALKEGHDTNTRMGTNDTKDTTLITN